MFVESDYKEQLRHYKDSNTLKDELVVVSYMLSDPYASEAAKRLADKKLKLIKQYVKTLWLLNPELDVGISEWELKNNTWIYHSTTPERKYVFKPNSKQQGKGHD